MTDSKTPQSGKSLSRQRVKTPLAAKKTRKTRLVNAGGKVNRVNNPPEETRWKKGCKSPNPAGRPKTSVFSEAARAILAEEDPKLRKTGAEILIEQAFRRARQGSYRHLELLLAYAEGKPKQSVDLGGGQLDTLVKIIHIGAKDESGQGKTVDRASSAP